MAKLKTQWDAEAREAALRIENQRAMGEQLTFLPDEAPAPAVQDDGAGAVGRPKGAKNKASSQLRDWLAHQGVRMPEDVIAEVAGLRSRDDAISLAMTRAERLLGWAFDGATQGEKAPQAPTAEMRLRAFEHHYTVILRALEALLPYVAAKASPDVAVTQNTTVIVPSQPAAPAAPGTDARVINRAAGRRMVPADLREKIEAG